MTTVAGVFRRPLKQHAEKGKRAQGELAAEKYEEISSLIAQMVEDDEAYDSSPLPSRRVPPPPRTTQVPSKPNNSPHDIPTAEY